jgi:ethanolamine transporter EutH
MGEPHVHLVIRRSAEYGGRIGPVALAAGLGGFVVWLVSLRATPALAAIGWLVGVGGMFVGVTAAVASAVGLLSSERRRFAARGIFTGSLAVLIPALLAFLVIALVWE